jgi:hypothetical protein
MATIKSARDVLLQAAATRLQAVGLPSNISVDFAAVTGVTKPADNADVTQSAINGTVTVTGGGITLSGGGSIKGGQTAYNTGDGFFLGYASGTYRFSIGNGSYALTWDGSTLGIVGDISGTSNINITGAARFGGATTFSGLSAAVLANHTAGALTGVLAYGGGDAAVRGQGETTSHGVIGSSDAASKAGVFGSSNSASGFGVIGENNNGGPAVFCDGPLQWGSYVWSIPGGSSQLALLANGTWGNPHAAYSATAGETRNNASGASLWCGAHQAVLQTDGNFVVYNSGVPTGSSNGGFPSDARLKQDIAPTAIDALDVLARLQVVDFRWRAGTPMHAQRGDLLETGLIAQAVREQIPTLVTAYGSGGSETLLLNKTEIVPLLIKAVQELSGEINSLRQKIRAE